MSWGCNFELGSDIAMGVFLGEADWVLGAVYAMQRDKVGEHVEYLLAVDST